MKYASVVIDAVIGSDDKVFDYLVPDGISAEAGMRVTVPFGNTVTEGFVLGLSGTTKVPVDKLKSLVRSPDEFTAVKPEFLKILDDICYLFKLRKIDVLRLFVPSVLRGRKTSRRRVRPAPRALEGAEAKKVTLTSGQQTAVDEIIKSRNNVFVLHGVTGSGKTEVYMRVIEDAISRGKSAIMLVPEIGLTPQVLSAFRARFGETVAILHSGLSQGERYDEWLRLHRGEAKIAIGARSAVFAPVENVGIIIIDEEHDGSYFSEANPRFYTHGIAKLRARYNGCPLILGSATPSVESFYKAKTGEYKLLTLDRRVNNSKMPAVEITDMIAELRSGNGSLFSRAFVDKLTETVKGGNQAMVFLNRRGFSSFVMCKNCGWTAKCQNCDVSLVYHKEDNLLKCHYCNFRATPVTHCKECGSTYLKMGSTGTQKVVEELQKLLPDTPIFRMDADNTKTKDSLIDILNNFSGTRPAVLVGTQMIAKGHHFPFVSFVGVIDADNSLHFSDYRAAERTFALITQVAGRAGRDTAAGHVIVQTYMPNHYVYRLAANYEYNKFFEKELNTREVTMYPPFTQIVRILITGTVDTKIKDYIQSVMKQLRTREKDFVYLGAMKSPLGRLQNKFRYQILMRFKCEKTGTDIKLSKNTPADTLCGINVSSQANNYNTHKDNSNGTMTKSFHGADEKADGITGHNESGMLDFIDGIIKSTDAPRNTFVFLEINPQNLS